MNRSKRPLTVIQMLPGLDGGGVERGALEVAEELVRCGHRSLVISSGGRLVQGLTQAGSEHLHWDVGRKSLSSLRWVHRLRRLFVEEGVDIVHARSRLPAWLAWLAWRGMPAAARPHLVTSVHGLYSVGRYSGVMLKGERVEAVSETVVDYIRRNYAALAPDKVVLIPRGVDGRDFPHGYQAPSQWLTDWHAEFPQLQDKFVITLPGRLSRLKGHQDLLTLLGRLPEPVHGLIVGGAGRDRHGYEQELRERAQRELPGRASFTGHRGDIREIFSVSDLVLSLSNRPESFGRTVLEALYLGVPVVGYAHGGVGEVLSRVFPAGLCPLGDLDRLEQRVRSFMSGEEGPGPISDYRLEDMLSATLSLYQDLAGS